jgi:hypothetical protein
MKPTNKVAAGVLAGALMVLLAWAVKTFAQIELPTEVSMAGSTLITFVVQYFVTDAEPAPSGS